MQQRDKLVISEHAIIHPNAKIAEDVEIGPWTLIGADVEIGPGCWIGPHVVIKGPTTIGKNNKIFQFSSIGDAPQDVTYDGEDTRLEIGDNNIIREYCMINRGTTKGGSLTKIGDENFLMAYVHIAHDCLVGNQTIFANYAALSGHVTVEDYSIIGAYSGVHQFCTVGSYSFIAKATYITKDVIPYVTIAGHTPSACGLNSVGLKRRGFTPETLENLRRAYKIVFRKGLTVQQALVELLEMAPVCPEVREIIDALQKSKRGIVR